MSKRIDNDHHNFATPALRRIEENVVSRFLGKQIQKKWNDFKAGPHNGKVSNELFIEIKSYIGNIFCDKHNFIPARSRTQVLKAWSSITNKLNEFSNIDVRDMSLEHKVNSSGIPVRVVRIGDKEHPATKQEIDQLSNQMESLLVVVENTTKKEIKENTSPFPPKTPLPPLTERGKKLAKEILENKRKELVETLNKMSIEELEDLLK